MKVDLNPFVGKVVRFKKAIENCENHGEAGMMARFASFRVSDAGTDDEFYIITFDFTEFDEQNRPFEGTGWGEDGSLTAREAGWYREVDTYYIDHKAIPASFELADPQVEKLHDDFNRTREGEQSYVEWLEQQLLAMRRVHHGAA